MDKNTLSQLESGVPCVTFSMAMDSKTMDSEAVLKQQNHPILLLHESVVFGPWTDILLQSGLISYRRRISGHMLGLGGLKDGEGWWRVVLALDTLCTSLIGYMSPHTQSDQQMFRETKTSKH